MPSKKKKYNSRFPPARIKKIMQTDEDIGKVAAAVPVLISKCLEMFLASLLTKAGEVTKSKRAKTMSRTHLKECIMSETMFDFLKDHVVNIPDLQNEEEASGSSSFAVEKDPIKKVVRKRSLPKAKKTPKKRPKLGHTNNNDSEEESDGADDGSENGSGNEASDALHSSSFSSSGLLSPTIQKKLELQSGKDTQETASTERKPSIHIPLDVLMSNDKIPDSVKIEKPTRILSEEPEKLSESDPPQSTTLSPDKLKASSTILSATPVRKGVIVENTAAYKQTTSSTSETNAQNPSPSRSVQPTTKESKSNNVMHDKNKPERELSEGEKLSTSEKMQPDNLPPITPQPGSMLSLLYSPVPMPLTLAASVTVPQASSMPPQEKYAYSPLTQHRFPDPQKGVGPPLVIAGTANGSQGPAYPQSQRPAGSEKEHPSSAPYGIHPMTLGYAYPYAPYDPITTQRHYLGYPQAILTPPSHHLAGVNSHMAAHPSLIQAKPAPRTRSDDDDYDT